LLSIWQNSKPFHAWKEGRKERRKEGRREGRKEGNAVTVFAVTKYWNEP
jgi:heme-degrading monooxygenase HmoA